MGELRDTLEAVARKVSRYRSKGINEQNTKSSLIQPILRALGWDVEDMDDVELEYKRRPRDKPVDYALLLLRNPRLFVEAKALGGNLDDRKWAGQIMGYAGVAGVEWVILTNGDEYRIYNAHAPVPVEEKLFRSVQIGADVDAAEETLGLLSKQRISENEINVLWNAHFVDRQVGEALDQLFATDPDPDAAIVRILSRRLNGLSTGDIKASLRRAQVRFDFPIEPTAAVVHAEAREKPKSRQKKKLARVKLKATAKKKFFGVSLLEVIETGLLNPPLTLEKKYHGQQIEAKLLPNGEVVFDGVKYPSPSKAADEARRAIIGGNPHTNGWEFWHYRASDGTFKPLDAARKAFLKSRSEG